MPQINKCPSMRPWTRQHMAALQTVYRRKLVKIWVTGLVLEVHWHSCTLGTPGNALTHKHDKPSLMKTLGASRFSSKTTHTIYSRYMSEAPLQPNYIRTESVQTDCNCAILRSLLLRNSEISGPQNRSIWQPQILDWKTYGNKMKERRADEHQGAMHDLLGFSYDPTSSLSVWLQAEVFSLGLASAIMQRERPGGRTKAKHREIAWPWHFLKPSQCFLSIIRIYIYIFHISCWICFVSSREMVL